MGSGSVVLRCCSLVQLAACGRVHFDVRTDGASDGSDALVDARSPIVARFEAESAQITPQFQVAFDPGAIGGMYLVDGNLTGVAGPGDAVYSFTLSQAGPIWVWGRGRATDPSDDSILLQIDGGTDFNYFTADCVYGVPWRWVVVTAPHNCPGPGPPQQFDLSAGPHTLRLHSREGGASIDALAIVDDPMFVPTD